MHPGNPARDRASISSKPAMPAIRFVTFNLCGLQYNWFDRRATAVIRGLARLNPDVVCLQETTVRFEQTVYDQAAHLGEALGLHVVAFCPYGNPVEVMSQEQGGIAVIARWPIRDVCHQRLPPGQHHRPDERVALLLTLLAPEKNLHVVTTHLAWRPEQTEVRTMQLGLLLDRLARRGWLQPGTPLVLAGDLNATDDEPAIALANERLQDAWKSRHPGWPGYTYLADNPYSGRWPTFDRRLDYIFCSPDAVVRTAAVVLDEPDPVYPSDHFGVMADIEW